MNNNSSILNFFLTVSTILVLAIILKFGKHIILPFIFSFFLAFLVHRIKLSITLIPKIGKYIPDIISYLIAIFAIIGGLMIVYEILSVSVLKIQKLFPLYQNQAIILQANFLSFLDNFPIVKKAFEMMTKDISENGNIGSFINFLIIKLSKWVQTFTTFMFTVTIYCVFILLERKLLLQKILLTIKDNKSKVKIEKTIHNIVNMIEKYVSVKSTSSLFVAVLCYIVLFIFKVDLALLWAFLIFLFNFIPLVGSVIAVLLPVIIALIQPDGGATLALIVFIGLVIMQQFVGSFVEPKLYGKNLNISPLVVILSLAIGNSLWGIMGMLISIPLAVITMIICYQFDTTRNIAILISSDGKLD